MCQELCGFVEAKEIKSNNDKVNARLIDWHLSNPDGTDVTPDKKYIICHFRR